MDLVVPLLPKASDGSSLGAVRVNNSTHTSPRWRERGSLVEGRDE
jgi:hypothetical protein